MPEDTQTVDTAEYDRFDRLDGADYDRVNEFLKDRVDFTAREWAVARLCADFRTGTGVEMTEIGENLPDLVPFMDDAYTRQAVYQARASFEEKVRQAGATFLYGAYADFLTADEFDDVMYEATETARFLIEVEGTTLSRDAEVDAENRVQRAMEDVHEASTELRYDRCPHCGERLGDEAGEDPDLRERVEREVDDVEAVIEDEDASDEEVEAAIETLSAELREMAG
ncbi:MULTISPECIES: DUF5806 family protein [Halostella]|uniref:DUF5806 family protein n=1 Tax=Halostella TaxID=1843185 RepID=UPI0019644C7D|nr:MULTISPECIES: DUF5806 family protein [Halostella]